MTQTIATKTQMTIEQFEALPDSVGFELIEGVLTARPPAGALASRVAARITACLCGFAGDRGVGFVFGAKTTYRCFAHPDTGRRGSVSFVRRDRFPDSRIPDGYLDFPADLVVEVISPSRLAYEVEEKLALYLYHGCGEVWIVYPHVRTVHAYRRGEPMLTFEADQLLIRRGPLEGFSCPVSQFFPASVPATTPA